MFYSTGPWRESPIVVCQKGFDKWEEGAPLKTQSRAPHFLLSFAGNEYWRWKKIRETGNGTN
jgi:hypothetical protein